MVANDDSDRNAQPAPGEAPSQREAQDRAKGTSRQASSPLDAAHVDAPARRNDASGHREERRRHE